MMLRTTTAYLAAEQALRSFSVRLRHALAKGSVDVDWPNLLTICLPKNQKAKSPTL